MTFGLLVIRYEILSEAVMLLRAAVDRSSLML